MIARIIYKLYKRKREMDEILPANGLINRSRYLRLMALASIDVLGCIPLGAYVLVRNVMRGVKPWTNWDDMHRDYSSVQQYPSAYWKSVPDIVTRLEFYRWMLVVAAFIIFALFGFADEARQHYRLVFTWLVTKTGPDKSKQAVWIGMEDRSKDRPVQGQGSTY